MINFISYECDCCIKENVCKYVSSYKLDCNMIKQIIRNETTEVSVKCSEFIPKTNIFNSREKLMVGER